MEKLSCPDFTKSFKTNTKATLLDVRNPDEIALGVLPGANTIPLPELESRVAELSKTTPVYIYCKAGGRAQKAGTILENFGFTNIICAVDGGYSDLNTNF